ncbi:MAG: AMP-binding protein [Rikenellaceae bacterium]|nr:AMP-binding protein [Rikenellaceae bacterium]MDY3894423.1 AMP-binding protein [Candidatus Cryptobacteroides sp.]
MNSFINLFNSSVAECWDCKGLSQFRVKELKYSELAREMAVLQDMWQEAGLERGDKISINAKSGVNWITVFMASVSGGYVSVQLFNGFLPSDTASLVCHSDSRILYTEKANFSSMDFEAMPQLLGAVDTESGELLAYRNGFDVIYNNRYAAFDAKYPDGYSKSDFLERLSRMSIPSLDDMCAIMYTSGSTGNPKGVMLSVRNFSANVNFLARTLPMRRGENHLSVLPYAHIFGLTVDAITSLSIGMHLCILGAMPIPRILKEAFAELHPKVFFAVPMILGKFVESVLGDDIYAAELNDYQNHPEFCEQLRQRVMDAMGGQLQVFATGGAAIPPAIESLLAFKLKTPFITGYGMTETAPVISLGPVGAYKAKSCGMVYKDYVDVKINSADPRNIPGEVMVKGDIVFLGYYKNPQATAQVLMEDGWLRTGDIGVMDEDNVLFLMGRCKNMLLSTNGQNIFPEEIEVVLNTLPLVAESLVVMRDGRLHAIIVPDAAEIDRMGYDAQTISAVMESNIARLNTLIPAYSAVNAFELRYEAFAKTPKGSIKRFMYS